VTGVLVIDLVEIGSCEVRPLPRILVVDDSRPTREIVVRKLLHRGCKSIDVAVDGRDAVEKYKRAVEQQLQYDIILMDYSMPNMNGWDATRELRVLGYRGTVTGITGNTLPADVEKFIAHGADKVLWKPLVEEKYDEIIAGQYPLRLVFRYFVTFP